MRRAPVHLDHNALGAVVERNPVAKLIGFSETQHDAVKRIAECALQRQTEDHRDRAGSDQ